MNYSDGLHRGDEEAALDIFVARSLSQSCSRPNLHPVSYVRFYSLFSE